MISQTVWQTPMRRLAGLTLLELVLAMAFTALLILGLVQIVSATGASSLLQENHARIQENARLAMHTLSEVVRQAGFSPQPWNAQYPVLGLAENTADAATPGGDRLAIRSWSDLNCYDNRNPDRDASGSALFYIRESVFDLNTGKNLTHLCRYGPSLSELTTQIRRQGFVHGVESFEVLYGEDVDRDGGIDMWVRAGKWTDPSWILGVKIGLLLAGKEPVDKAQARDYAVLDEIVRKPADRRLRQVYQFSASLRGRSG